MNLYNNRTKLRSSLLACLFECNEVVNWRSDTLFFSSFECKFSIHFAAWFCPVTQLAQLKKSEITSRARTRAETTVLCRSFDQPSLPPSSNVHWQVIKSPIFRCESLPLCKFGERRQTESIEQTIDYRITRMIVVVFFKIPQ